MDQRQRKQCTRTTKEGRRVWRRKDSIRGWGEGQQRKDSAELAEQKTSLAGWSGVLYRNQLARSLGARNQKEQSNPTSSRIPVTGESTKSAAHCALKWRPPPI